MDSCDFQLNKYINIAISPFVNASEKNIDATICIGWEIQRLPYAVFFDQGMANK